MSRITINDLSFSYAANTIFEHTDINLDDSWRLGLVGRNGRGKTTLLHLLTGAIKHPAIQPSKLPFRYFPQTIDNPQALTSEVLAALADFEPWQLERELSKLVVDLGVLNRPFASLSGGEQTKCLLALLFIESTNFPLLDEPTNHLDQASRQQVARYLQGKSGYIVVSHDQSFLDQVSDHILAIEQNQVVLYQGNYGTYLAEKERQDKYEQAQNERLKKDVSRLKATAREKTNWANNREADKYGNPHVKGSGAIVNNGYIGARAARTMKKAKNLEKRLQTELGKKEQLLQNVESVDALEIESLTTHHKIIAEFTNFTLGYVAGQPLFKPLNFKVLPGEIVALTGPNGIGKSSLLALLLAKFQGFTDGEYQLASNLQLSVVSQFSQNKGDLASYAQANGIEYERLLTNLRKLGLERQHFQQPIETLSVGQQRKVILAASLSKPAQLYIWDEPLNYLDLVNQEQLINLLQENAVTMILIEHNPAFIQALADKEVSLEAPNN
ncbi:ATPase component of ABC transporter with duplicated ATPase domains [Weissella oryzae SG25]|uniref:ATPase component of ABC transporter with duplicated ATPase domains n=1 Tax=Weissella oryzae (strain DSM 25784 / JCM 18191 / LMG 30913 / SG25) TaxID=1329250 RepID=A0A069CTE8_WEIOS|nr:ABC-F type ribosomal protection protein [Weissella oryzae]GAK30523.1 ATPase component of ABC transporter with duplicated ATPase domains [Weissella oryzae SG25]